MRNVITTNGRSDVDEEYAEQVDELLNQWNAVRETRRDDDFYIRLHSFEVPGTGEQRWAVDYSDPVTRELEETDDETEASERYEELVKDAAENLGTDGDGCQERFDVTDVDDVPGPLPTLPNIEPDHLYDLLDAPGTPVLYLERTQEDELVVKVGQEDPARQAQALVTRRAVLDEVGLADGAERITSDDVAREWDGGDRILLLAYLTTEQVKAAADGLFTVPDVA